MSGQVELSDIQRFYRNSTVFLTGATGFIGKLILEKILRALPVKKVLILVRAKKDLSIEDRVKEILDSPVFDKIKRNCPNVLEKIVVMEGDCSLPLLGLSSKDVSTFKDEVDVVIHSAATTRFDEHISKATMINIRATKDLLDLAKQTKQMKVFIYIGTAYSNSNEKEIKESIYPPAITAEKLISVCESLDDDTLTVMTPKLLKDWPNTYTFTKQVIEEYIDREGKGMPICICRPAVVTSTSEEPMNAFVENVFSLPGIILLNALGLSRICYYKNTVLGLIPADYVVNECIAAGWHTGENFKSKNSDVPIYNMTTSLDNPLTQGRTWVYNISLWEGLDTVALEWNTQRISRSRNSIAPYGRPFTMYNRPQDFMSTDYLHPISYMGSATITPDKFHLLKFFFHTLVAWFMDLPLRIAGKKPKYSQGVEKLHKFQEAYEYFSTESFFIHVENTHKLLKKMSFMDRSLFNFDTTTLNWDNYFSTYSRGLRFYLLGEKMDTLPAGSKHYNSLRRNAILGGITVFVVMYALAKIVFFRIIPAVLSLLAYFIGKALC